MKSNEEITIYQFFYIFNFFLDTQLSEIITLYFSGPYGVTSHLFLLVLLLFILSSKSLFLPLILTFFFGLLFDFYYFDFLGLYLLALPITTVFVFWLGKQLSGKMTFGQFILLFLIAIFLVDFLSFFLAQLFHLTYLELSYVMTFQMVPTLIFNVFLAFCFRKKIINQFY
ncbi:UNVERIFIED_CONTAM: rod shape-determining protein MreD [Streptococcus canis]